MKTAEANQPIPLRIDIVSDVVCPWCIIGYRQLQRALEQLPGIFDVQIHWQPFELNPRMPPEGQELREHLAEKYGTSPQQSQQARQRLTELGESLGFHFDYYEGMRIYNTFLAHQLLHWAGQQGLQTELKLALFEAFFSRRENVGDCEVLAAVAARVGLDSDEARELLASGTYAQAVRAEQARWLERDVHAVPMFFLNDGYGIPGAQDSATFLRVFEQLRSRASG
jgi:predicted DsbA family dithiol-disulfide isomerase